MITINLTRQFAALTPDALMALIIDIPFCEKVASTLNLLEHKSVLQEKTNQQCRYVRQMSVEIEVPSFAKKLIDSTVTLEREDVWDLAAKTGSLSYSVAAPITLKGTQQISSINGITTYSRTLNIDCNMAFIKGKVETLLADKFNETFNQELDSMVKLAQV